MMHATVGACSSVIVTGTFDRGRGDDAMQAAEKYPLTTMSQPRLTHDVA